MNDARTVQHPNRSWKVRKGRKSADRGRGGGGKHIIPLVIYADTGLNLFVGLCVTNPGNGFGLNKTRYTGQDGAPGVINS